MSDKIKRVYLDSNVIIDILTKAKNHPCTLKFSKKIYSKNFEVWISDYTFAEVISILKRKYQELKGQTHTLSDVIPHDELEKIVQQVEKFLTDTHVESFRVKDIKKSLIFDEPVKKLCISANDVIHLLAAKRINVDFIVSADARLVMRAKPQIQTRHPRDFLKRCPRRCPRYKDCGYRIQSSLR